MSIFTSFNVNASGMTAQRYRMDIISENVANMNTTRTEGGGPYRRKVVVLESQSNQTAFQAALERARGNQPQQQGGVRVAEIAEDPSDFKLVYDPTHPDANDQGYVEMPNVDLVKEIADAMAANQAYSANVTAFNVLKQVTAKGLEIGK